jgi:hypothetical protein
MKRLLTRFLLKRPFLNQWWLSVGNRAGGVRLRDAAAFSILVALFGMASVPLGRNSQLGGFLQTFAASGSSVALATAVFTATFVFRRKRRLAEALGTGWLASTPMATSTLHSSVLWGSLLPPALLIFMSGWLLLGAHAIDLMESESAEALWQALILGSIVGCGLGQVGGRSRRSVYRSAPALATKVEPGLSALSHLPLAYARQAIAPAVIRWPLALSLMSVMVGSSAAAVGIVIASSLLLYYLCALCCATLRAAREAAAWVASTPMSLMPFVKALASRSLLHQLIGSALLGGLLACSALGVAQSCFLVGDWIALVVLAYGIGISDSFRRRTRTGTRLAVGVIIMGAAEHVQRGAAVPLSLVIASWHVGCAIRGFRRDTVLGQA